MNRTSGIITKHKKAVVAIFLVTAVVCTILQFFVSINYNIIDYLPKDAQSTIALSIMKKEFTDAVPNARVMLNDVSVQEAIEYKKQLAAIDGVSDVLWLDDVIDIKIPLEMADQDIVSSYYKDEKALISLTVRERDEVKITKQIYEVIGDNNQLSGEALNTATSQKMATTEATNAMLVLIPMIILILLISTSSWVEPLFFLFPIGISILINLGTNIFIGEISFMTQAISPILQLAVSLDYAIFLLHRFGEYRTQTDDVTKAMQLAMKRSFPAIIASAATTLFGFVALTFMKFRIGVDLGFNLMKGIVLSFVCVMVFLPALTLCFYKWIDKTKHKVFLPRFKNVGNVIIKIKMPCLLLVALLIVPCFLAQSRNIFTYGTGELAPHIRTGKDTAAITEVFGESTTIVLILPKGDSAKELMLCNELEALDHITQVVTYANMVGNTIPDDYLSKDITKQFYSENYCRMILYTDTKEEGNIAFQVVEQVQNKAAEYYGDTVYSCGQSVNLYDMKNIVAKDNNLVNMIAIIAILLVLLFTFRSITLPLMLLLTIETAIWINLSVPYFTGSTLNYIGYLVISTVQLGATVDYAILLTDNYRNNRMKLNAKDAIKESLGETFISVLISASILSIAGFCLWLTSSNPIVSQVGLLLGRGTVLSMLLVLCFLPIMLLTFDKIISKTTLNSNFYKEGR